MAAPANPRVWVIGTTRIEGPLRVPPRLAGGNSEWHVKATDTLVEDSITKVFSSVGKAQTFIDEITSGAAPVDPLAGGPDAPAKSIGAAAKVPSPVGATPATLTHRNARMTAPAGGKRDANVSPFNLKAVAEALIGEEMDPFVEVAKALKKRYWVIDGDGKAVIDPTTGEPAWRYEIGITDRAKILIELGQYIAPKLKAVEVKVEDKRTLSEEQLNDRIGAFLARANAGREHIEPTKDAGQ